MIMSVVIAAVERVVNRTKQLTSKLEQERVRKTNLEAQPKFEREAAMRTRRVGTEMPAKARHGIGPVDGIASGSNTIHDEIDIMVDALQ